MSYLWLKAFHLIAVISWMAGLLYLPRLFVYHREVAPGMEASETFKTMERRLLNGIMLPAVLATWLFGLSLAWLTDVLVEWPLWFTIKAVAVVALTLYHVWMMRIAAAFARDERPRDQPFFRIVNEIPAALMVVIVMLAVLKPI
jgi:putative membrane protein